MYLKAEIEAGVGAGVEAPVVAVGAPALLGAEAPLSRPASLFSSLSPTEPG